MGFIKKVEISDSQEIDFIKAIDHLEENGVEHFAQDRSLPNLVESIMSSFWLNGSEFFGGFNSQVFIVDSYVAGKVIGTGHPDYCILVTSREIIMTSNYQYFFTLCNDNVFDLLWKAIVGSIVATGHVEKLHELCFGKPNLPQHEFTENLDLILHHLDRLRDRS